MGDLPRWAKLDSRFLLRSTTTLLLDTFGPFGPLVFLAIILECESSEHGRSSDTIEVYYGPMARYCGCTPDDVALVVRALVDLGQVTASTFPPRARLPFERQAPARSRSVIVRLLNRPKWAPEPGRVPRADGPLRARPARLRGHTTASKIVTLLGGESCALRGPEIAERIGHPYSSSTRGTLSRLVNDGAIQKVPGGYAAD